jgi:hypothetical protein
MTLMRKLTITLAALSAMSAMAQQPDFPTPQKVVIVIMENHDYEQIVGDTTNAPFINGQIINGGLLFTNAHAIEHPSQPNYLDFFSGSNQGANNDNAAPTNNFDLNALVAKLQAAISNPATPADQIPALQGQLSQIQGLLAAGFDPKGATGDAFPIAQNFNPVYGEPVQIPFTTPNLASVLLAAGRTFTEFAEGLTAAGAADEYGYAILAKINNPRGRLAER